MTGSGFRNAVFAFIAAALISSSAWAESGMLVCKGPMDFSTTIWADKSPAAFMDIRFYPNRTVAESPDVGSGQCAFLHKVQFAGNKPIETMMIRWDQVDGLPVRLITANGASGSSPSFIAMTGNTNYPALFNRLMGKDPGRFWMTVARDTPDSLIVVKKIDLSGPLNFQRMPLLRRH